MSQDRKPEPEQLALYQRAAEFLYGLGWRPDCDAQHTNLRDALPDLQQLLAPGLPGAGPAFPVDSTHALNGLCSEAIERITDPHERERAYMQARTRAMVGISQRTYIATKAMAAFIAWEETGGDALDMDVIAGYAYAMADAMLKAGGLTP